MGVINFHLRTGFTQQASGINAGVFGLGSV